MDPRSVLPLDEALKTGNVCNDVNKMRHSRDLSIIANLPAFPAESYFIRDVLGKGSCGTVFSAHLDNAHQKVALKMIRKATEGKKNQIQETHIENEILLLSIMNSPYIVQYFGAYQTENDIIIVTELLEYGDLWSAIYESPLSLGGMPSDLIRFYAASLVLALSHIHSKGVAYRDLKPENVMLDRKGYIRIIDFGFAKSIPYRVMDRETGQLKLCSKSYTVCGTPEYLPPEVILRSGHDSTVDLWALGVLIFEMVMGRTPFKNSDNDIDAILLQNIVSTKVKGVSLDMGSENALTQDLVFQLLQAESRERLGVTTTTDVLTHDFFTDIDIESVVDKSYMPSYIPQPSHPSSPAEAELSALPWVDSSLSVPINAFFLLSL